MYRLTTLRKQYDQHTVEIIRLILIVVLLVGLTVKTSFADQLRTFTTKNYTVHTDAKISVAKRYAKHMDRVFNEYKKRFENESFTAKKPKAMMDLYLLRTKEKYAQQLQAININATNSGGMYVRGSKGAGLYTYIENRSVRSGLSVLQHEGFHQFASNYIGNKLPQWANEGIAEYFEDGIFYGSRVELDAPDARRLERIQLAIRNKQTIPFQAILQMTNKTWRENMSHDQAQTSLQYAQAWSMVYFMIRVNDKTAKAFKHFLEMLAEGVATNEAFTKAFNRKTSEFHDLASDYEDAWKRFTLNLQPTPISIAEQKLRFMAVGLKWIKDNNDPYPSSLTQFKYSLQKRGFYVTRTVNQTQIKKYARDDSMFKYQISSRSPEYDFAYKRSNNGLPPMIWAPQIRPCPVLVWYRRNGELRYEVTYK